MRKTTLYLSEELEAEIEAAARRLGVSKAEFVRRAAKRLASEVRSDRPLRSRPYPVLAGGRRRSLEEMDEAIYQSIKRRVSKR